MASNRRSAAAAGPVDVLLVSMPFGPLLQPSIGLSLLKAGLTRRGVSAAIRYFSLDFARLVGAPSYLQIELGRPRVSDLPGEWIFSGCLFEQPRDAARAYVDEVLYAGSPPAPGATSRVSQRFVRRVRRMRRLAEPFMDQCAREVVRRRPRVVGFTSTFQQHVASLALARRIRAALPDSFVIFGGGNCEGVMGAEVARQFPFVDAVVSGEGDHVFPEIVERVRQGRDVADLPGVSTPATVPARGATVVYPNAAPVTNMDALPYPDYDDYFEQYAAEPVRTSYSPLLLVETSRGCWWGQRQHCTFCGLNPNAMAFRSKSADRALAEVSYLTARHNERTVTAGDNILDLAYLNDFLPALAERGLGLDLFYEVKANLRKAQVRQLREAGATLIQPGIESFSRPVLEMMRKGVGGLQNIQLLKWCREFGITPLWNILFGFPGEPPDAYARMARLLPLLTHLTPPMGATRVRLDRFSPHFDRAEAYGLVNVRPAVSYRHIYPVADEAVTNLAYYFDYDYAEPQDVAGYTAPVVDAVRRWKQDASASELFFVDTGLELRLWDERPSAQSALTVLTGLERTLYLACDRAQHLDPLLEQARAAGHQSAAHADVRASLDRLVAGGLAVEEASVYLSLAIPVGHYAPSRTASRRFEAAVHAAA